MIDLSAMKGISVDPERRVATAQPGLRIGGIIVATERHGLVSPTGTVSDTGLAGLTLGGGYGWLSGKYGLAVDNLIGAEVVTADGRVLRASESEHPNLFWAPPGAAVMGPENRTADSNSYSTPSIVIGPPQYQDRPSTEL